MKIEPQQERVWVKERPSFPPLPTRPKEIRMPKFSNYTPLNTNRGWILRKPSVWISYPPRGGQQLPETQTPPNTVISIRIIVTTQKSA